MNADQRRRHIRDELKGSAARLKQRIKEQAEQGGARVRYVSTSDGTNVVVAGNVGRTRGETIVVSQNVSTDAGCATQQNRKGNA